jgi:hypothetical protein
MFSDALLWVGLLALTRANDKQDLFDTCDLYSLNSQDEGLRAHTPAEALLDLTDTRLPEHWADPVVVYGWKRDVVSDSDVVVMANAAAENVSERYSEDYGDCDGEKRFNVNIQRLARAFEPAIRAELASIVVWRCKCVAKREYSAAEVAALVGKKECA